MGLSNEACEEFGGNKLVCSEVVGVVGGWGLMLRPLLFATPQSPQLGGGEGGGFETTLNTAPKAKGVGGGWEGSVSACHGGAFTICLG